MDPEESFTSQNLDGFFFCVFPFDQKRTGRGKNVAMETSFLEKIGPKIPCLSPRNIGPNSGGAWEVALKLLAKVEKGGN